MTQLLITLTFSISIATMASAARILIIHPYFSKSHAVFNDAIASSLLEAGHQVTAITCFPKSIIHENYTAMDTAFTDSSNNTNTIGFTEFIETSTFGLIDLMVATSAKKCSQTFQLNEVQQLLKSKEKPIDLLIIDIFAYLFECFLPIADLFHIPVIGTIATRSWRQTEWIFGNPYNPAVIPFELSNNPMKMTLFQRMKNLCDCLVDQLYHSYVIYPKLETIYQQWFPNHSVLQRKKPSLLFVNGQAVFNSRPLLPTIVNVGGIHVKKEKPLPKNLQTFIDKATHGVILFSIGSVAQSHTMPATVLSIFREVFAEIPQRVIWKAEEKIESLSENILLSKWLPQRDILAHKNVVAFISHSGISGTYEALYSGVPVISIPIFFDQLSNAAILQELGVGIQLDVLSMTKENLHQALNNVINGTKYKNRLKEISTLIQDQPKSSRKMVTYWTEYVLRHNGTEHIQTESFKMPSYQNLLLDVFVSVFLIIFITSIGFYYLLKVIYYNPFQRMKFSIHFKKHD